MKKFFAIFALVIATITIASPAEARPNNSALTWEQQRYAAFVVDTKTGKILHQEAANQRRYPASLTKMMTLYLAFEALKSGVITTNTPLKVSANAASRPQTNLFLKGGDTIRVRDAIPALVIRSANDVAVVVAENLAGSEAAFAQIMTKRAHQLGMTSTVFKNANGLPNAAQYTTAKDMAILAIALQKHYPQYYHYFKQTQFSYGGRTYITHNRLVKNYPGADGLKTGFINASGFNVATSVKRSQGSIIGVVMGGRTAASRDQQMAKLLDQSYVRLAQLDRASSPQYAAAAGVAPRPISKGYRAEGGYSNFVSRGSRLDSMSAKNYAALGSDLNEQEPAAQAQQAGAFTPTPIAKPAR